MSVGDHEGYYKQRVKLLRLENYKTELFHKSINFITPKCAIRYLHVNHFSMYPVVLSVTELECVYVIVMIFTSWLCNSHVT